MQLYDWEIYELLNIIELADWGGKKIEYGLVKDSANHLNLDKFEWINAFDDPEAKMVLEKRYPTGVRIIIDER